MTNEVEFKVGDIVRVHGKMELRLPVDHGVVECPKCGAVMRRIYTPTVAIYKGTGFTKGNGRDD